MWRWVIGLYVDLHSMTWAANIVLGRLSVAIMYFLPEYSLDEESAD